ncbi:aminoglycoside phosphotransferase [Streptomyces scabiei]|uniref:hypothetical protein n=1 Tax=Streptomyces scabiei TaxID=1930 RepID=UPI000E6883C3|nr:MULTISPECIES: hypothetical protein [Streptomyces]MBP5862112.1 hypothetical protein [Streptomyces sp. LBUM 1484]MBP5877430.1 hypothetical protein [Streptomyces sp. LBUM 1477]MBP5901231.1 hypothetical protein [Streptomyces sp. LBUM 1488]MDW8474762.1 aminoglycoside phosphotransferase [Streptomyces scabiei]MDX2566604.1 aminoglycoside phosphotransferase [Streptomyces scabiei]
MTSSMLRVGWADLPGEVREAVEARAGRITDVESLDFGEGSEFKAVLGTPTGRVFAKATPVDGWFAPRLYAEAMINPYVTRLAPRLLWQVKAGGWLVLGFVYVQGRHADYSPGSQDLDMLAEAVAVLQDLTCPAHVSWPVERRWAGLTEQPHLMAGQALVHKDLNPRNVLISEGRAYIVDWATPCRGADWVELALFIPRLIAQGHSPGEAEQWAARFRPWRHATAEALDAFAAAEARKRQKLADQWPWPNQIRTANGAWKWAHWRASRLDLR